MWCRQFVEFHGGQSPMRLGAPEITRFLNHLANAKGVAASTQNQALSALIFLFREVLRRTPGELTGLVRVRRPQRIPTVLSREEVRRLVAQLEGLPRVMAVLIYGGGLCRAGQSQSARTRGGTPSPRTCSRMATIGARFRSCSGTRPSRPR